MTLAIVVIGLALALALLDLLFGESARERREWLRDRRQARERNRQPRRAR